MRIIANYFLIFISFYSFGQKFNENKVDFSVDWEEKEKENENIDTDITENISSYDLSKIWLTNKDFPRNGAIGSNYQRIQVYISSVIKDINDPLRYLCKGKTKVNNNICDFTGEIKIKEIKKYKKVYSLDDTLKNAIGGSIIADYNFLENKIQSHTDIFKGVVVSYWYLDTLKNKIHYNELQTYSDSYEKNTFVGTWKGYNSQNHKLCIWGDYRIPYTDGLYVGAGDIIIGSDYIENGWKEFTTMWTEREESKSIKNKWWK